MFAIGKYSFLNGWIFRLCVLNTSVDYPYDQIQEGMNWWKTADLKEADKELIGRENAIKLFKLPLEI